MTSTRGDDGQRHIVVVLAICAAVLAPTLAYRMGVDQGVFAYMGGALLEGKWPYVHTWESDFPGLIFLQAVEILIFGRSVAAFRLFDLLVQLVNAYLLFRIALRTSGWIAATIAPVLFCLIYQGYGPWNTAQREGFGMLFILIGYWLTLTAERRSAFVTAAVTGVGLGLAVTIKPTLLALSLFYVPLITQLRTRRSWGVATTAAAGLLLPAAVLIAGYWAAGVLVEMYEACVAYQAIYTARLRGDTTLVVYWLEKLGRLGLNAVVLPIAYVVFLWLEPSHRRERLMLWLGYAGSIYAVFVQGTFAGYHYLPGMAIGSIFVGSIMQFIVRWLSDRKVLPDAIGGWPTRVILVMLVLVPATGYYMRRTSFDRLLHLRFLQHPVANEFRNQTVFDFTESYETAEYLRARTQPGEPIQVWGYESIVYYLADRTASSRFQMTHPLVMRVPGEPLSAMQEAWRKEFIAAVTNTPPAYVAVVRDDRWWWAPGEHSSEELLDDFPAWKTIIERNYQLDNQIGRFLIYRRRS